MSNQSEYIFFLPASPPSSNMHISSIAADSSLVFSSLGILSLGVMSPTIAVKQIHNSQSFYVDIAIHMAV
jgi:hypothetical protein